VIVPDTVTITAIEAHHIRVPFDMGAPPTVFAGMAARALPPDTSVIDRYRVGRAKLLR
jgi:hypothetical protein